LKCIQGDYTGRFEYLNNCSSEQTETKGILIGGKPDYNLEKNPKGLSIYLEDPKLDEVHCHIFCRKYDTGNQFIIKDLSNHNNPDTSGVWIQMPGEEVDLMFCDYIER
jgi:hypothetical protein